MAVPRTYNLGQSGGMDKGQLWHGNTVNIDGQQYMVINNGDNTVSFQPMGMGGSSDQISQMQAEIDRINKESEQARRREAVRGETESYLSSKKDSLGDIAKEMEKQRDVFTSQLDTIYSEIDKAVEDKNFQLAEELKDEAQRVSYDLDKFDATARQKGEQIKEQNFNNARAANRTDTSLLSNLINEPGQSTSDILYGIGDSRKYKEGLLGQRGEDINQELMSKLQEASDSKNQYAGNISSFFNPVNTAMDVFKNKNYGNFMVDEYDAGKNRQAIDSAFNQINSLLGKQAQQASIIPSQFQQQHHGIGQDVVAVDDQLQNTLNDNADIQKSITDLTPSSMPITSNYEGMVEQLGMQRQSPSDKEKRYASSLYKLFNKGSI